MVTTWYCAGVQSGLCPAAFSGPTVVTVIAKVDDAFAGDDQIICNSSTATISANNPVIGKGKWSQLSGPPANLSDPFASTSIVNGLKPGYTYSFVWTISGAAGCGSSADEVQIINRPSVTTANAGGDIGICNFAGNSTLVLSANKDANRPNEKGAWKIIQHPVPGSGAIANPSEPNAIFSYNQPGRYLLTWTITSDVQNGCGASADTLSISIAPKPVAQFKLQSLDPCTGNKIEATNSSVNAENFAWYWGDGDSSLFENGSHSYAASGTYDIWLIARKFDLSATCTDTARQTISVIRNLQARIKVDSTSRCIPYNLQVSAADTSDVTSVEWRFFDSSTPGLSYYASGMSASYFYNNAGADSVRMIVRNINGCSDSYIYRFMVYDVPSATVAPGSIKTCEHDTTMTFTAAVNYSGTDPVNYRWLVNNQVKGVTNPFTYRFITPESQTGNTPYSIKLLAQNAGGCGDTARAASITVMPVPPAGIKVSPSIIQQQPDYTFTFEDTASSNPVINYLWMLGDRSMQSRNGKQVTFQYSDTGTYHIKLLATDFSNGCVNSDTTHVTILYVPGYIQVPNAICPGCTDNALRRFLPLGKGLGHYRLRILTTWGKVIFETTQLNADGSPKEAWDGKYNGTPAEQGSYRWEIEGRYVNGTEWRGMLYPGSSKPVKTGFLTIIK